jgi:hypothetical protein
VPQEKIESLWRIFCKFDSQSKGYVTLDDFYDKLIKYPRNGLTDQMTKIIGRVCMVMLLKSHLVLLLKSMFLNDASFMQTLTIMDTWSSVNSSRYILVVPD